MGPIAPVPDFTGAWRSAAQHEGHLRDRDRTPAMKLRSRDPAIVLLPPAIRILRFTPPAADTASASIRGKHPGHTG